MNKKITVIGATGMIGLPVTKELIKAGFEVTALVRNEEKAKQLFPTGLKFIKGDIRNSADIAAALKNADAVYLSLSITQEDKEHSFTPETVGLDNILEEVRKSPVGQIVYLSSLIARNYHGSWWVMNVKKTAIEKVRNAGIPYTIFYPSTFMENLTSGMRSGNKLNTIGKANEKAYWIAGEDFGKQVANAFKNEKSLNKEYAVQGLEPYTMLEAAKAYAVSYPKEKLQVVNLPLGLAKFIALFVKPLKFVVPLMEIINNNKEGFESQNTWDDLGKPEITLTQFAKR